MDDERTQQTLDDLAELFLTGTAPADDAPRQAEPNPPKTPPPTPASPHSAQATVTLEGPAPIKLRPKPALRAPQPQPAPRHASPSPGKPRAEQREAPDQPLPLQPNGGGRRATKPTKPQLRYTGHEPGPIAVLPATQPATPLPPSAPQISPDRLVAPSPDRPDLSPPPTVEAVLLGNLPGMAGAWLTQYAQLLAQRDGPVALLYIDDDTPPGAIEAELVEPTIDRLLQPTTGHADGDGSQSTHHGRFRLPPKDQRTFAGVLEALSAETDQPLSAVLIHTDSDPRQIDRLLDVGVWTVLSGADETAVAAATHLLTSLVEADGDAADVPVGVFVMGADEGRAAAAGQRLADQTAGLFASPVEMLGYLQKMTPVALRDLGRFPTLADRWAELSTWLQTWPQGDAASGVEEAETAGTPTTFPEPQAPASNPGPSDTKPLSSAPEPKLPPLDEPVRVEPAVAEPVLAAEPQHSAEAVVEPPTVRSPALPVPTPDPVDDAPPARRIERHPTPDLVALLLETPAAIDGLATLQARCPAQPNIQLAADAAGRVHLLAHHDSAAGDALPSGALLQLRDAGAWAHEHRDLLALTSPGRALDPAADPVLHLFTDRADLAVPLAAKLGPSLKLHLLQPLDLADEEVWYCTPLSR